MFVAEGVVVVPVVVDVGPRDGLQDEAMVLDPVKRAEYINRLSSAGFERIEVTSFVNPARVPQMANAEAVISKLTKKSLSGASALVLNERGLERAGLAGIREINYVAVVTDTFSLRNQGFDTASSLSRWDTIRNQCEADKIKTTLTLAAAFGCPFEGEVSNNYLYSLLLRVADSPPDEICVADTIGAAVPTDVIRILNLVKEVLPAVRTRLHCHNTRNSGMANAYAAVVWGVGALDSSTGGLGGCPFSNSTTGNIPSEDLIYMLDRMGYDTGIRLSEVIDTASWICGELNRDPDGMLVSAGQFPPGYDATND
jgi:hydroxymethylglutaryl-CoA lyase